MKAQVPNGGGKALDARQHASGPRRRDPARSAKRLRNVFTKIPVEMARYALAVTTLGAPPIETAKRYWHLYRHRRFSPREIHFHRLLDPAIDDRQIRELVSKEELLAVQRRLNPPGISGITENKVRFYERCRSHGLPTPRVFAVYNSGQPIEGEFSEIRSAHDLQDFLETIATPVLVVKPWAACHGEGVFLVEKDGTGWKAGGRPVDGAELARIAHKSSSGGLMFQEYVTGHTELARLSGTNALQTFRVVTIRDEDSAEVVAARLRLITGSRVTDNFDLGRSGNVIANLEPTTGEIRDVIGADARYGQMINLTKHPVTGTELVGHSVLHWSEVQELAIAAAEVFRPAATVGWDVALTKEGACLVEANVYWDPLCGEPRMAELYSRLGRLAEGCGVESSYGGGSAR